MFTTRATETTSFQEAGQKKDNPSSPFRRILLFTLHEKVGNIFLGIIDNQLNLERVRARFTVINVVVLIHFIGLRELI